MSVLRKSTLRLFITNLLLLVMIAPAPLLAAEANKPTDSSRVKIRYSKGMKIESGDEVLVEGDDIFVIKKRSDKNAKKRRPAGKDFSPPVVLGKKVPTNLGSLSLVKSKESTTKKTAAPTAAKPTTHTVARGTMKIEASLSGIFESKNVREISLKPKAWESLSVASVAAQGKRVKKGDLILQFETKAIDKAIQAATEGIAKDEIALKKTMQEFQIAEKTGPEALKATELAAKQSAEDLQRYIKIGEAMAIESAKRTLQMYERSLENQTEELKQLEKMYKEDDLTEETEEIVLKRQRYAVESAKYSLERAKVRLQETLKITLPRQMMTMKQTARTAEVAYHQAKISLPYKIHIARLELKELQKGLSKAKEKLGKLHHDRKALTIVAPIDGLVYYGRNTRGKWSGQAEAEKKLRKGGKVLPGEVVMAVVDTNNVQVRVAIAEKELGKVSPGRNVSIAPTAFAGEKYSGKVKSVSPIAVSTAGFDGVCAVKIPDTAANIMPGMTCKVTVHNYHRVDAIAIPAAAVHSKDGVHSYVHVLKNGKKEHRWITIGKRTSSKVEVLDGLKVGEVISLAK